MPPVANVSAARAELFMMSVPILEAFFDDQPVKSAFPALADATMTVSRCAFDALSYDLHRISSFGRCTPDTVMVTLNLVPDVRMGSEGHLCLKRVTCLTAGVAQLVEHLICNQRVGGSNPFASSRIEMGETNSGTQGVF
jgi:hypothetical protein